MRVALLVSDDPHQDYLVALLDAAFDVCGVLVEPGGAQKDRLWKRRRYADWLSRRYHGLRRDFNGDNRFRAQHFADLAPSDRCFETVNVKWINSKRAISTMDRWKPDIAILCGTNYVKNRVLLAADRAFNIHGGCLPEYKGNHGVFFALAEGRFDLIGATLHEVSAKLDAGALVEVVRPPIYPSDNDETLYCRADQLAMLRLVELLHRIERGDEVPAIRQPEGGRMFRHRDRTPRVELRAWLRRLREPLPCVPIARIATTIYDSLGEQRLADPLVEYSPLRSE